MSANNSKARKNERREVAVERLQFHVNLYKNQIEIAKKKQKDTRNHESEQVWYECEERAKLKLKSTQRDLAATKQKLANS